MSLDPKLLKQAELFSGLDDKEAKKIAPLFKGRDFSAGEVMAEEGKHGVGFFLIESGPAKGAWHGEERTTLGPAAACRDVALLDAGPRPAPVTAVGVGQAHSPLPWASRPTVR